MGIKRVSATTSITPLPFRENSPKNTLQNVIDRIGFRHPLCSAIALTDWHITKNWKHGLTIFLISEITFSVFRCLHPAKQKSQPTDAKNQFDFMAILATTPEMDYGVDILFCTLLQRIYKKFSPNVSSERAEVLCKRLDGYAKLQIRIEEARKKNLPATVCRLEDKLSFLKVHATIFDLYQKMHQGNQGTFQELLKLLKEKKFRNSTIDEESKNRITRFLTFLRNIVKKEPEAMAIRTRLQKNLAQNNFDLKLFR